MNNTTTRRRVRRGLSRLLTLCMLLTLLPTAALAAGEEPTVNDAGTSVCANGVPIKIVAGREEGKTNILYGERFDIKLKIGNIEPTEEGYDLSDLSVYGGGESGTLEGDPSITMTGGTVKWITGGGKSGSTVKGDPSITVEGGSVTWISGGGADSTVDGNPSITVKNGTVSTITGGGGEGGTVKGAPTVAVSGGKVTTLYGGGGNNSNGTGSTTVTVTGGKVTALYGGGNGSTVSGKKTVTVGGGAVVGNLYINGGTPDAVTDGVASFAIGNDLTTDASVSVNLPAGYTDGTIATGAVEGDLDQIQLTGDGATGLEAYFDANGSAIKVRAAGTGTAPTEATGGTITDSTEAEAIRGYFGGSATVNTDVSPKTITLTGDVTVKGTVTFAGGEWTLDLAGRTLAGAKGQETSDYTLSQGVCPVTLTGSSLAVVSTGSLQGGDGGGIWQSSSAPGGKGLTMSGGTLTLADKNVTLQGGTGGAAGGVGGNGLNATGGTVTALTGVTCRGGDAHSSGSGGNGGNGIYLGSGVTVQDAIACTAVSGQPKTYLIGYGLNCQAAATIAGGTYEGAVYGAYLAPNLLGTTVTVTGGTFTGDQAGLSFRGGLSSLLAVTGGSFTGGSNGLSIRAINGDARLSGGSFTGKGESAYAVNTGDASKPVSGLLAADCAYFGTDGSKITDTEALGAEKLGQNTTLRVRKVDSKPEVLYGISGTVTKDGGTVVSGAAVTLRRGAETVGTTATDGRGAYRFTGVPAGLYNVAAEKGGKTKTILVELVSGNATEKVINLPDENKSSLVTVAPDAPAVVAGGVDTVAEAQTDTGAVVVTLKVERGTDPDEKTQIDGAANGQTVELYLDLSLVKTVGGEPKPNITDTGDKVLEIVVPYALAGKENVTVYRAHGAEPPAALAKLAEKPADGPDGTRTDGTFWLDTANGLIHIYASKFSTYAVAYTAVTPPSPGSSGGGGSPAYTLTATAGEGGQITPSSKVRVSRNNDQTFTVTPDEGYEIADVLVDGKSVGAVKTYTFKKLAANHTIAASFRAEGGKPAWNPFADVREGAWYYNSVKYVYERELMNGTGKTAFSPDIPTTRGMIVTILWRLEEERSSGAEMIFGDVKADSYCYEAVCWGLEHEIVKGYTPTAFGPDNTITRQELAAILYRYAQYKGMDVSAADDLSSFVDRPAPWADDAVKWAVGAGILSGQGGILDPNGQATRAQAAAMLTRFLLSR